MGPTFRTVNSTASLLQWQKILSVVEPPLLLLLRTGNVVPVVIFVTAVFELRKLRPPDPLLLSFEFPNVPLLTCPLPLEVRVLELVLWSVGFVVVLRA